MGSITLELPKPSLSNNTADAERLLNEIKAQLKISTVNIHFSLLKTLPDTLRQSGYHVRCILVRHRSDWLVVDAFPASDPGSVAALAVDLGTSRVVLRLMDAITEEVLGESAMDNPQISIGPDILARIHHTGNPEGLGELNGLIINGLNRAIAELCGSCGLVPEQIYGAALAGNTAMTHLFLCLNPRWIIREPYIPVVNRPGLVNARDLGLCLHPAAGVYVFPNIGSYFGGDLIAGILYSGMGDNEATSLLVDVGTNAEVVLGNKHWLMACAGAAGPALEGGVTQMGMMAAPGVIDKITVDPADGRIHLHTIGETVPKGICGSGLIDLAAGLFQSGMLDIRGKLIPERCGDRIITKNGLHALSLVPSRQSATGRPLTLDQADIDSLIRSKAAMYTILETITATVGVTMEDISTFFVAGAFGSFIDPVSAITIGMLPDLPLSRFKTLGNSSLGGATLALTQQGAMEKIDAIRDRITYLELNVNQEFMNRFSAAKFLPHTDRSRFPSVSFRQ